MALIQPVILSGGSGTRLWPASRSMYPKQLLPLTGERTMLQETALRLAGKDGLTEQSIVVCNEAHRFLVAEQLREIGSPAKIVLEPEGRNTAPAVAVAAILAIANFIAGAGSTSLLVGFTGMLVAAFYIDMLRHPRVGQRPISRGLILRGLVLVLPPALATFLVLPEDTARRKLRCLLRHMDWHLGARLYPALL